VGIVLLRGGGGGGKESASSNPPSSGTQAPSGGTTSPPATNPPPATTTTPVTPPVTTTPTTSTTTPGETAGGIGSLEVITSPPQARISINGKTASKRSNSTLTDVTAGSVTVKVEKDGYLPQTQTVDVPAGGVGHVNFTLEPNPNAPVTLEIKVTPFATYYVNDQQVASNVASTKQQLKPGTYNVRAVHPAFDPKEWKNVRLEPGKPLTLSFDFIASSMSTLRVTSDPWAEVVVDGQKTGKFTPCELKLSAGTKTVVVVRDGFVVDGGPQSVSLKPGTPVSVSFKLKRK
jgi:hypothetical protein